MNYTIILIELIKFYYFSTDQTFLDIKTLKEAYEYLAPIIKEELSLTQEPPDFNNTLDSLLDLFTNNFQRINDQIMLEDIDELPSIISTFIEQPPYIQIIRDLIFDTQIYTIFKININIQDFQAYFDICQKIMYLYSLLAYQEYKNLSQEATIQELQECITDFQNMLITIDLPTLTKILIISHKLDEKNNYSKQTSWEIILFSDEESAWQILKYYNLDYYGKLIYDNLNDGLSPELTNVFFDSDNPSTFIIEETVFLSLFLFYLQNFLASTSLFPSKDSLIAKKYLLLSTNDLEELQNHYLKYHKIKKCPFIKDEEKTNEDYTDMINITAKCAQSLNYSDQAIFNNPSLYAKLIINALFTKCFLKLSGNESLKKYIQNIVTTYPVYKDKNHTIVSDIIDNIIFSDYLERNR